ncbi:nectin-2-like isoform X2 [Genypterus blacodes]|uniref:nectin-2-like isoform X2 n=1 Tax=Genypterus blacodes TaxID=154954 RepID=UPI003F776B2C
MCVLLLLFLLNIFPQGVRGRIETQQTVMAELGQQAQIPCELLETRDVLQVTWQKVRGQGEVNLAAYSEFFGTKVNAGFEGKVEVKPGLQSSSLVVRNLTEQDEGCYLCLFNTHPDGAITGKSCLKLYELQEPRLDLRDSNRTVSCSVTGRPAVTVSLNVSGCDLSSLHTSTSVINANGTVSVTATAGLSAVCSSSTAQVRCAGRVFSGPERETITTLHVDNEPSTPASSSSHVEKDSGVDNSGYIAVISFLGSFVFVLGSLVACLTFFVWKAQKFRDPEQNKKPQTSDHTDEPHTPLIEQENETRKRSPKKPSPHVVKCLF